jgi:hypothetical protein
MTMPRFFTVNDRPVKIVEQPDGSADVMVLDMRTGEWERDPSYLDFYFEGGRDVDLLTEAEFTATVAAIRKRLGIK